MLGQLVILGCPLEDLAHSVHSARVQLLALGMQRQVTGTWPGGSARGPREGSQGWMGRLQRKHWILCSEKNSAPHFVCGHNQQMLATLRNKLGFQGQLVT